MIVADLMAPTLIGVVGGCAGSFTSTIAMRHARGLSWTGRSRCDSCSTPVALWNNLPVIAYVMNLGVCRSCGQPISAAHPSAETVGAIGAIVAWLAFSPLDAALAVTLVLLLIWISVHDVLTLRIPDPLSASVAVVAGGLSASAGVSSLLSGISAATLCVTVLWALSFAYRRVRGRAGVGLGDVKLLGAVAIWLGPATPLALSIAAAGGLIWVFATSANKLRTPFGPFIAAAAIMVGFGRQLWIA